MRINAFEERLLTADEVATHLGLAKQTIYNKVHRNEIPFVKVGRSVRFRLSQIEGWINEQTPEAA